MASGIDDHVGLALLLTDLGDITARRLVHVPAVKWQALITAIPCPGVHLHLLEPMCVARRADQ